MTTTSSTAGMTSPRRNSDQTDHEERGALKSAASDVKSDLRELKHDTASMAAAARDCAKGEIDSAIDLAKDGGEKVQELHTALRSSVSSHPTTAILISFGVGAILGRLMARR